MNPKERERLVDSLLDRELGPQLVEPRPGLEERILANLAAQPERHPWWQRMWIPALAATTVLAVVIGISMYRPTPQSPVYTPETGGTIAAMPTAPKGTTTTTVQPPHGIAKHVGPKRTVAVAQPTQALPRQAVFPAPVPLTDQERLLLAFVNRQRPQAELIAAEQQAERERIRKYFETGEVPETKPIPAQPMR
jgi:hypothetical protein